MEVNLKLFKLHIVLPCVNIYPLSQDVSHPEIKILNQEEMFLEEVEMVSIFRRKDSPITPTLSENNGSHLDYQEKKRKKVR